MANGMVAFHNAMKITEVPFPFPYAQVCDCILVAHWLLTPFVISVSVTNPVWSFFLCFIQIFVLWSLNFTAIEIENPYGKDANDVDGEGLQRQFNLNLRLLVSPKVKRTPTLAKSFILSEESHSLHLDDDKATLSTFKDLLSDKEAQLQSDAANGGVVKSMSSSRQYYAVNKTLSRAGSSVKNEDGSVAKALMSRQSLNEDPTKSEEEASESQPRIPDAHSCPEVEEHDKSLSPEADNANQAHAFTDATAQGEEQDTSASWRSHEWRTPLQVISPRPNNTVSVRTLPLPTVL